MYTDIKIEQQVSDLPVIVEYEEGNGEIYLKIPIEFKIQNRCFKKIKYVPITITDNYFKTPEGTYAPVKNSNQTIISSFSTLTYVEYFDYPEYIPNEELQKVIEKYRDTIRKIDKVKISNKDFLKSHRTLDSILFTDIEKKFFFSFNSPAFIPLDKTSVFIKPNWSLGLD